jgi:hypothetical protein
MLPVAAKGEVTVIAVEPLMDPEVAVMVVLPLPTLVAKPDALIVAVLATEEFHATVLVMFFVVASE